MTRRQEIEAELKCLYERSAKATNEQAIRGIEARISYLECELGGLID